VRRLGLSKLIAFRGAKLHTVAQVYRLTYLSDAYTCDRSTAPTSSASGKRRQCVSILIAASGCRAAGRVSLISTLFLLGVQNMAAHHAMRMAVTKQNQQNALHRSQGVPPSLEKASFQSRTGPQITQPSVITVSMTTANKRAVLHPLANIIVFL
jgi:hypothetical protein